MNNFKKYILLVLVAASAIFVLFPFFWMFLTAFKEPGTALQLKFLPDNFTLEGFKKMYTLKNFAKVWTKFEFGIYFKNSLIIAGSAAFFATFFAAMAGYVFAKKEFFLKDKIFYILLGTMMIPGMMYMTPQFYIIVKLGWYNTYKAMVIPHLASVFGVLMMTQFIKTIPTSLIEAAKIDGASEWQIFRIIIIPLSLPIVATLFLMTFLFHWSNFLWQLVVSDPGLVRNIKTIPVGLAYFSGQYGSDWELMMAAACYSIVPIALLFLFAQRLFIEGMTQGAVKG